MPQTTASTAIRDLTDSVVGWLGSTIDTGIEVLQTLGTTGSDLASRLAPRTKFPLFPKLGGCCDIPPPCWVPEELPPVHSHVCAGATAVLRFQVTNTGMHPRVIRVTANKAVTIEPPVLNLGPLERGWISVSYSVAATSNDGECTDLLLFVQGCNRFYLRWNIRTSKRGCACCHEVDVEDGPDLIHHWYDHFYCQRPCQTDLGRGQ